MGAGDWHAARANPRARTTATGGIDRWRGGNGVDAAGRLTIAAHYFGVARDAAAASRMPAF
jgi:hypothetical protein